MRKIGKKWTSTIVALVNQAKAQGLRNLADVQEYVNMKLPEAAFDTWENAWVEIKNVVSEELFKNSD